MNDRAANSILTSKVKIGATASAAGGPVGRESTAATDYSYVRRYFRTHTLGDSLPGCRLKVPRYGPTKGQTESSMEKMLMRKQLCSRVKFRRHRPRWNCYRY